MKRLTIVLFFALLIIIPARAELAGLVWPTTLEGNLAFPTLYDDGNNGAILVSNAVTQYTDTPRAVTRSLLQARRVDPIGNVLWVTNLTTNDAQAALSSGPDTAANNNCARTTDGNYVFVWNSQRTGSGVHSGRVAWEKDLSSFDYVTCGDGLGGYFGSGQLPANGRLVVNRYDQFGNPVWTNGTTIINKTNIDLSALNGNGTVLPGTPAIALTTDGGAAVVWREATPEGASLGNSARVFIQKVDQNGAISWGTHSVNSAIRLSSGVTSDVFSTAEGYAEFPCVVSDGAGGAIAAWAQDRGPTSVDGARIDAGGNYIWGGPNDTAPGLKRSLGAKGDCVTLAATGEYFFLGWRIHSTFDYWQVQKFRVSDGTPVWIAPLNPGNNAGDWIQLLPDGQGGVLAFFQIKTGAGRTDRRVDACYINQFGTSISWNKTISNTFDGVYSSYWTSLTDAVFSLGSQESGSSYPMNLFTINTAAGAFSSLRKIDLPGVNWISRLSPDGQGGFLWLWQNRNAVPSLSDDYGGRYLYAQRIDGGGNPIWSGQTALAVAAGASDIDLFCFNLLPAGSASANLTYTSSSSGAKRLANITDSYNNVVMAQLVDPSGRKKWAADGLPVILSSLNTSEVAYLAVAADDTGGAAVVFSSQGNIYAQWLDKNGSRLLGDNGLALENGPAICTAPKLACVAGGRALAAWHDESTNKAQVRGFNSSGSYLGAIQTLAQADFLPFTSRVILPMADGSGNILFAASNGGAGQVLVYSLTPAGVTNGRLILTGNAFFGQILPLDSQNIFLAYSKVDNIPSGIPLGNIMVVKCQVSGLSTDIAVNTSEAWQVIADQAAKTAFPWYTFNSDGQGGVTVAFEDFRNEPNPAAILTFLNSGQPIDNKTLGSFNGDVVAQWITSAGTREWGDSGLLLAGGPGLQELSGSIQSIPNGSTIFSSLDTAASYQSKGELGWLAEAASRVQKAGPISTFEANPLMVYFDAQTGSQVSSAPEVSITAPAGANITIYDNGQQVSASPLNFRTVANSTFYKYKLSLTPGKHDILIEATDSQGNKLSKTLTVNAVASGVVGAMTVLPAATGQVRISYVLAADTSVRLIIFSPTEGTAVMNRSFSAGTAGGLSSYNEVVWNGKLPSGDYAGTGIYPVKLLTTDGKELSKAYIVVR